jgi:hypothetical protein
MRNLILNFQVKPKLFYRYFQKKAKKILYFFTMYYPFISIILEGIKKNEYLKYQLKPI